MPQKTQTNWEVEDEAIELFASLIWDAFWAEKNKDTKTDLSNQ